MPIRGIMSVTAALLIATSAYAQQGQPGAHFIENWDMNGDSQVTLAEAQEKRGDLFYMFDSDENGLLNASEYDLFDETRRTDMDTNAGGHKKGAMKGVDKAMMREFNDVNGDGQVSRDEFVSRATDWFTMMDRSGDGVVTTDDFGRKGG
ncbi:MAG: Ca2+-binding EF-hand superfamily protein [Paracoccaceae bacterium]|jgi:Ca2+-binding EF-hand superfamily protein